MTADARTLSKRQSAEKKTANQAASVEGKADDVSGRIFLQTGWCVFFPPMMLPGLPPEDLICTRKPDVNVWLKIQN